MHVQTLPVRWIQRRPSLLTGSYHRHLRMGGASEYSIHIQEARTRTYPSDIRMSLGIITPFVDRSRETSKGEDGHFSGR
jgi:hypothetical protein